jgi:hypothetical protein
MPRGKRVTSANRHPNIAPRFLRQTEKIYHLDVVGKGSSLAKCDMVSALSGTPAVATLSTDGFWFIRLYPPSMGMVILSDVFGKQISKASTGKEAAFTCSTVGEVLNIAGFLCLSAISQSLGKAPRGSFPPPPKCHEARSWFLHIEGKVKALTKLGYILQL